MKQITILIAIILFGITSYAQQSKPRYGTASNQDNTGRNLTWGIIQKADTAGATLDTIATSFVSSKGQNSYNTDFVVTVTDSVAIAANSVAGCRIGDRLTFILNKTTGAGSVKFTTYRDKPIGFIFGSGGASIALTSGRTSIIQFVFNGTVWVETSRSAN